MFQLTSVLACTIFSVCTACASAAEEYSVIPEPAKTGVQAAAWTEQLPSLNHLLYRTYLRACFIAEAGWSPVNARSWKNFQRKLSCHRQFIPQRFSYNMERTKENEPFFK